jgi:hypothetical protein
MALKLKLEKSAFEKLPADVQKEYVEEDGEFVLQVIGAEDTGALKRAKDHEKAKRLELEGKVVELTETVDTLRSSEQRLKTQHETVVTNLKTQHGQQTEKMQKALTANLVDNVANGIATNISKAPALLLPHLRARLQADFTGDQPKTVVLDKDGKPSALTLDQLKAEFVANPEFAAIIVASKASGGGAPANPATKFGGGAPANGSNNQQPADLSKATPQALAAMLKETKATQE